MNKFFASLLLFALTITLSTAILTNTVRAEDKKTSTGEDRTLSQRQPKDEIVARVNDFIITYQYHQLAINSLKPKMSYHNTVSEDRQKLIEETALENLVVGQLLYEEALKRNIKTTEREVKAKVRKFHNTLPKGTTLRKILKQSNMTREDLEEEFRRGLLIEKVKTEIEDEVSAAVKELVTDAFMKDYYNNNRKKFVEPEKTHLSELLIKADPGGGRKHWLEIREKASEIEARIRGGEDFAEVAKKESQDSYASNGGDMGWAHTGSLDPALQQAINKLQPGEISEPVESLYGYHIIKLHDRKPSKLKPYEELNLESLKERLNNIENDRITKERVDSLKEKADIVYYEPEN